MKSLKRYLALILALCLCAGLLSACTQEEEEERLTFRAALSTLPATLDPALATTATEKTVLVHLFENLMKLTPDGPVCAQAKSYTCTDNEDGTQTYVFTLREDICWSDGKPVTAQDFAYSWVRLLDPELASPNAAILDTVAGYDTAIESDPDALQVWADEQGRLVVVLSEPDPCFLSTACTAVATMPIRQDAVEGSRNWAASKATLRTNGAYGLRQWTDNRMEMVAVETYYDHKRLGPECLEITFTADQEQAMALFRDGRVDFAMGAGYEEDATVVDLPVVGVVVVNQMAGNLGREEVRRAMNLAIDRNALAAELGENYVAADGLIPSGISTLEGGSFRAANGAVVDNNPEDLEANLAAAKELLQRSGWGSGWDPYLRKITLLYESSPGNTRIATMLQQQWKDNLGIEVTLQSAPTDRWKTDLTSGEFTLALLTVTTDRNDASSLLRAWQSEDPRNYGQYYSSAYEMLLNVAAKSTGAEAHDAYLEDAERLLVESGYAMPLYMKTTSYALRNDMLGLFGDGLGTCYFTNISVIPAA